MKIRLDQIKPNPFRNFGLYPLDEEQIQRLKLSIDSVGFFASVTLRPTENGYEIAGGHHRIEAARRAGLTAIEAVVETYTDDQMVEIMTKENLIQYGNNEGAILDSVAAYAHIVTRNVLLMTPVGSNLTQRESADRQLPIDQASIVKDGPGPKLLYKAINGFSIEDRRQNLDIQILNDHQIRKAIDKLRDDGLMGLIVSEAYAEVESIRAAQEKAEADAREAELRAKREAEAKAKSEQEAAERRREREEAERKAAEQRKQEAERKRKQEEERKRVENQKKGAESKSQLYTMFGKATADILTTRFTHPRIFISPFKREREIIQRRFGNYLAQICQEADYPEEFLNAATWNMHLLYPHLPKRFVDNNVAKVFGTLTNLHSTFVETERLFKMSPEFGVTDPPLVAYNKATAIFNGLMNAKNGDKIDPKNKAESAFKSDEGKAEVIICGKRLWPVPVNGAEYNYDDLRCAYGFVEDVFRTFLEPSGASMNTKLLKVRHLMSWINGGYNAKGATLLGTFEAIDAVAGAYAQNISSEMKPPSIRMDKNDGDKRA